MLAGCYDFTVWPSGISWGHESDVRGLLLLHSGAGTLGAGVGGVESVSLFVVNVYRRLVQKFVIAVFCWTAALCYDQAV